MLGPDLLEGGPEQPQRQAPADAARIDELRELLARFVGSERAVRALSGDGLSIEMALTRTERVLSGTLGAASARVIVAAFGRRGRLLPRSARALIDEASEAIRYNYEILRNTLDHVGMGIAAFDRDGRLEIFNDRFTTLLSLDDASVAVGAAPMEFGATPDVVALLRRPEAPQTHEIATRGGRVIELRLDPLPGGGFVATCNDVTARVRTAEALRESDRQLRQSTETLEQRVIERTAELEASRAEAEAANLGKTRFIAAASHDLLQPLHAARLFTAAMIDRDPGNDLGGKIDTSLGAVESLLDALLDISKLDAGAFRPEKRPFALQPMFEFAGHRLRAGGGSAAAPSWWSCRRGPSCRPIRPSCAASCRTCCPMRCATAGPRAVRRACCWAAAAIGDDLRIEVKDNGPGIAADKQAIIFDEFVRLQAEDDAPREERGLGLGLAIVDRIARMLDLPVGIASAPGAGLDLLRDRAARAGRGRGAASRRPRRSPRRRSRPRASCSASTTRRGCARRWRPCSAAGAAASPPPRRRPRRWPWWRAPAGCPTSCWPTCISTTIPTVWRSSKRCAAPGDAPFRPRW